MDELMKKFGSGTNAKLDAEFWGAVEAGQSDDVKRLLDHGIKVESRNKNNWTALEVAANKGHASVVNVLLDHGDQSKERGENNWRALHFAAEYGYVDIVKALLDAGFDPDIMASDRTTALQLAARSKNLSIVKLLLARGAKVNAGDLQGFRALHWAAFSGAQDIVKVLLNAGADPTQKDGVGKTAVFIAQERRHQKVADLLMQSLRNVAAKEGGQSIEKLLHVAIEKGNQEKVRELLASNAQPNAADKKNGWTALHWAASRGDKEIIELLLEAGANPSLKNKEGKTAQEVAQERRHKGVADFLAKSLELLKAPETKALHEAIQSKQSVQDLLDRGADPDARNSEGAPALHVAAKNGNLEAVEKLIMRGADPMLKNYAGKTALEFAENHRIRALLTGALNHPKLFTLREDKKRKAAEQEAAEQDLGSWTSFKRVR